jgi:hypothetical protein
MALKDVAFVGREEELARLDDAWAEACTGHGRVVFVTGEPGDGKSALLNAFATRLREREPDAQVADGDCNPQTGTSDAFLPFREILAELTGTETETGNTGEHGGTVQPPSHWLQATRNILLEHGPDLVDIFVPGGALVTRLGAQAADRLRKKDRDTGHAGAGARPGLERRHLLEQYTNVIRNVAAERPLALIVDDLHWADEASVSLMFHLARRLQERPVLLLGAYRANEVHEGRDADTHALAPVINELKRYFGDVTIDLQSTQEARGRRFIDELLDAEPNDLDHRFRDDLYRHTGGQALFTVETLHHLKEQGSLVKAEHGGWIASPDLAWDGLPARVDGVIRERLRRLPTEHRELLEAAAVLGEQFHVEPLALMLDREPRSLRRALSDDLSRSHRLVQADKLERLDGLRLARYAFRHNLIHRFLYEALDDIERPMLHERAAEALEQLTDGEADALSVHLARHFDLAQLPDRAAPWYLAAGQRAQRSLALEEARRQLEAALRCCEADGRAADAQVSLEAADALARLDLLGGAFERARDQFHTLRSHPVAIADPEWQARLLEGMATAHERLHEPDEALAALAEAIEALGPAEASPAARHRWLSIQVSRLWVNYWKGDIGAMREVVEETRGPMEAHGRIDLKRRFYNGLGGLGFREDRFLPTSETVAAATRAHDLALESERTHDVADSAFGLGFTYLLRGEFEHARPILDQALEQSRRCGDRTLEARCLTYRVMLARMRHEPERVKASLVEARTLTTSLGMREYDAVLEACEAWLAWHEGDGEAAGERAQAALDLWAEHAPGYPMKWLAQLPCLALDLDAGQTEAAVERARAVTIKREARLGQGVEEALTQAVEAYDSGDTRDAEAGLASAVELALRAGYL